MKKVIDLSTAMTFSDEAVATNARQRILTVLLCGIGATLFSTGIVIGTTKNTNEKESEQNLEEN